MAREWNIEDILADWRARHPQSYAAPEDIIGRWLSEKGCVGLANGTGCFCPTEDAVSCGEWYDACRAVYSLACAPRLEDGERVGRCVGCDGPLYESYGCLIFTKPGKE